MPVRVGGRRITAAELAADEDDELEEDDEEYEDEDEEETPIQMTGNFEQPEFPTGIVISIEEVGEPDFDAAASTLATGPGFAGVRAHSGLCSLYLV